MEDIKQIQIGGHRTDRKYKRPVLYAKVDAELFGELNKYQWSLHSNGHRYYAVRWQKPMMIRHIFMHHQIIGKPKKGMVLDHINGDTLDNRRANLRFVTPSQNIYNTKMYSSNKTGHKGVVFNKKSNRYTAMIGFNKKKIYLGSFPHTADGLKKASLAYKNKSAELHGKYAREVEFVN